MALPNVISEINIIKSTYLPKSGGTISGVLYCSNELCGTTTNPDNTFDIRAMRDTNGGSVGGSIRLFNKNRSQFPGGFELQARTKSDTSDLYILRGTTDGVLTWNGADVITSHGGDMSGRLNYNIAGDAVALCGNDDGTTRLVLRSDLSNKGAFLNLYGINYSNSVVTNGAFQLCACSTGSDYKVLIGSVDGTLQWVGKDVVCVKRWTSGTSGYREYSDGYKEQWGRFTKTVGANTAQVVNFHIPFTNTNYHIGTFCTGGGDSTAHTGAYPRNNTSFNFYAHWTTTGQTILWSACGY